MKLIIIRANFLFLEFADRVYIQDMEIFSYLGYSGFKFTQPLLHEKAICKRIDLKEAVRGVALHQGERTQVSKLQVLNRLRGVITYYRILTSHSKVTVINYIHKNISNHPESNHLLATILVSSI